MRRINYKSDIPPLLLSLKVDENQITVPDCDFIVRFYIEGYEGRHYDCSHIGGVWSNCEPSEDGTKLVCYINNQRLGIGELCAEFHYISPDRRYSDGSQKSVVIIGSTELGVELVEDNGDAVTEAAIDVTLPFIYRTAYEIARGHGYTGTAEDFYGALASVVGIADAEKKRATAEITRNANEQERIENEENRLNAENDRVNAETQRVRYEAIRRDAESDRVEQEEDRKAKFEEITGFIATVRANEGNRESNERERQANEDTRITEEAKRVDAEKKRASEFEQQKLDLGGKIDRSGDEMGGDLIFTDNAGVSFNTSNGGAHAMFNDTDDVAKFTADNGDTFEFKQNETPSKNSSAVVVSANLYNALDMTLESMGSALDGDAAYRAEAGDKIFNPDTCKIQIYNSTIGGFEDLCDPIEGKLYANKMTDYIYRWNTEAKKMVFVGGVKAYTKEEADSRFAKLDDATQRVKVKELDAYNYINTNSMWIGDEGLLLGGDGNGHLTVEQDEVITDVTLNEKLATKADDVAYGVEWNNGQPTGEIQETTVKEATKNTTFTALLLAQSYNALETEVEKKADKTELATKVDKTDIVQSTGTSTTAVMSQKSVSDAIDIVADSINKLKNAGYLYAGIATPTTNPGTPDGPVFYIALQAGTYSNFGNTEIDNTGIFTWDGSSWSSEKLGFIVDIPIVNDLITGGEGKVLSAEMGKVLNEKIENKGDDVYMVTSSSLADAVAEVPSDDRKVGLVIGLPGEGSSIRRYKYMGKYYTDVDWLSEGAWLDLDNADKYKVYYFRLCPTIEGHVDNASINSSGEVTTGTKHVTGYIAIPESGVSIGGGFYSRYTLYDSGKNKVSTNLLYGGKSFTYSTTESAFIRLEYENNTPVWLFGYVRGISSAEAPSLPHVEVIEDFENLIDYDDNTWAGDLGPFIRLRKGETINLLERGSDTDLAHQYFQVQSYNINQEPYGNAQTSKYKYVMPIDGYVKIGGSGSTPAFMNARYNILSKSIARTRAKKRLLVVGDSISVFTWDNTQSKDVIQGYPFFLATQGDHELSVTNQAVGGNTSAHQLTTLQNKDVSVYDAVTIFIGTNDYGYSIQIDAFKSNIAAMVDYITAQNPACKIGFFTLIHRASAWDGTAEVPNARGAVLSDYCTAIKEVAMNYGLPVLDLWNDCQCNFNFSIYKENYSSQDREASGDGLHPTNEAHKLFLYPLVREFVKKLL